MLLLAGNGCWCNQEQSGAESIMPSEVEGHRFHGHQSLIGCPQGGLAEHGVEKLQISAAVPRRTWLLRWNSCRTVRPKRPMRLMCGSVRLKRLMRLMCGSVRLKRLNRLMCGSGALCAIGPWSGVWLPFGRNPDTLLVTQV